MTPAIVIITILAYFAVLFGISHLSSRKSDNATFFTGNRRMPWPVVAFATLGAALSGVTFISVPGMVAEKGYSYLQMGLGFIVGYALIAFVLVPLFYKRNLISIYGYLGERFGASTYRTGAWFFFASKMLGASVRFFVVCIVLQTLVFDPLGIPFTLNVLVTVGVIWLYTFRGGVKSVIWTDLLKSFCLVTSVVLCIYFIARNLHLSLPDLASSIAAHSSSQMFFFDDPSRGIYFWKQFVAGIFMVIAMTGLDQDMMQKNLTCRSLREAQKNMCAYGACFLPVNLLLLALGILLYTLCSQSGMPQPAGGDTLLPSLVAGGELGTLVIIPFTLGIVTAAFSSADSALTALTTSCCVDLLNVEQRGLTPERQATIRQRVHIAMTAGFLICILLFRLANDTNVINAIYVMASYTYGPLLGLYAFGLLTHRGIRDKWVPAVAITSPVVCALLDHFAPLWWNYTFGYELLMLNGLLTFAGLAVLSKKRK